MRVRFPILLILTLGPSALLATPPFATEPAFGGVKFEEPVQVVFAPGETTRAFVVERRGTIAVVRDLAHPRREVFLDLGRSAQMRANDHGTMALAFHPQFAANGICYVWFSTYVGNDRANRLAGFKRSATHPGVADPASEFPLLTQVTGPGGHDGGELVFGPDGYLYLSLGDGDANHVSESVLGHQRIDRNFFGAILRLDVDRRPGSLAPNPHASVHAGSYAVPPDNPFVGATSFNGERVDPARVRTEFWAVGLRNPWRIAFDPATGWLWCGDVGLNTREEIDVLVRGGNYGWDFREGAIAGPRGRAPSGIKFVEPVWDYDHTQGASITGGFVYHGKNLPGLEGRYLIADYVYGKVWALQPDGDQRVDARRVTQIANAPTIVGFAADPRNGDPLLASFTTGQVLRLVRK